MANIARKSAKVTAPILTIAEKIAAAVAGTASPAASESAAWLALLASVPAIADAVAESRAGKYGANKGLVPHGGDMLALTPYGKQLAESGTKKNGKPNAQAATCRAIALACAATGGDSVCRAAVIFYMVTSPAVLQLLHGSKATDGNGNGKKYIGRDSVPCPAWCNGYVNGNLRQGLAKKA